MILKTVLKQEVCPCVPAGPPTGTSYVMRGKCAVAVLAQKHMRARGGHCRPRRYEIRRAPRCLEPANKPAAPHLSGPVPIALRRAATPRGNNRS